MNLFQIIILVVIGIIVAFLIINLLGGICSHIDACEKSVKALASQHDLDENAINRHTAQIATMEKDINNLQGSIHALNEQVALKATEIDHQHEQLITVNGRIPTNLTYRLEHLEKAEAKRQEQALRRAERRKKVLHDEAGNSETINNVEGD